MNRESRLILPRGLNRRGFLGLAAAGIAAPALASCAGGPSTSGGTKKSADIDYSGVKPASQITFWSVHPGDSQQVTAKTSRSTPTASRPRTPCRGPRRTAPPSA